MMLKGLNCRWKNWIKFSAVQRVSKAGFCFLVCPGLFVWPLLLELFKKEEDVCNLSCNILTLAKLALFYDFDSCICIYMFVLQLPSKNWSSPDNSCATLLKHVNKKVIIFIKFLQVASHTQVINWTWLSVWRTRQKPLNTKMVSGGSGRMTCPINENHCSKYSSLLRLHSFISTPSSQFSLKTEVCCLCSLSSFAFFIFDCSLVSLFPSCCKFSFRLFVLSKPDSVHVYQFKFRTKKLLHCLLKMYSSNFLSHCIIWRFILFLLILFQNTLIISECIICRDAKAVWDSLATVHFLKYLFATVLGNRIILREKKQCWIILRKNLCCLPSWKQCCSQHMSLLSRYKYYSCETKLMHYLCGFFFSFD